ncbi:MAG TPA: hypothetical protein VFJ16_10480 [Longimicrobium sp.]|nr:hypothetical protein [Longimicrobium sp.]
MLAREREIALAPESERARLLEREVEFFDVDTANLTRQQRYDLAVRQIAARAQRFRIIAIVVSLITITAGMVTVYSTRQAQQKEKGGVDGRTDLVADSTKGFVQRTLSGTAPESTLVAPPTQGSQPFPIIHASVRAASTNLTPYRMRLGLSINGSIRSCWWHTHILVEGRHLLTCEFKLFHLTHQDVQVRLASAESIVIDENGIDHPATSVRLGRQFGQSVDNILPPETLVAGEVEITDIDGSSPSALSLVRVKYLTLGSDFFLEFRNVPVRAE